MNAPKPLRLFEEPERTREELRISSGAMILTGFVRDRATSLWDELQAIAAVSPFRHMLTRRGHEIHVATTACGDLGWVSDRSGYRYDPIDPCTGKPWPAIPDAFSEIARSAALVAGFENFEPDSCLINRYGPETISALHQDGERDATQPVVTISIGVPVAFMWGGNQRNDRTTAHLLTHGDVMVFGGVDRRRFHGVKQLKGGDTHPLTGVRRYSITLRRAS